MAEAAATTQMAIRRRGELRGAARQVARGRGASAPAVTTRLPSGRKRSSALLADGSRSAGSRRYCGRRRGRAGRRGRGRAGRRGRGPVRGRGGRRGRGRGRRGQRGRGRGLDRLELALAQPDLGDVLIDRRRELHLPARRANARLSAGATAARCRRPAARPRCRAAGPGTRRPGRASGGGSRSGPGSCSRSRAARPPAVARGAARQRQLEVVHARGLRALLELAVRFAMTCSRPPTIGGAALNTRSSLMSLMSLPYRACSRVSTRSLPQPGGTRRGAGREDGGADGRPPPAAGAAIGAGSSTAAPSVMKSLAPSVGPGHGSHVDACQAYSVTTAPGDHRARVPLDGAIEQRRVERPNRSRTASSTSRFVGLVTFFAGTAPGDRGQPRGRRIDRGELRVERADSRPTVRRRR